MKPPPPAPTCTGCPVERTLDIVDNRWTSLILRELLAGPQRFNQLKHNLPGISPKTLTQRLKELEGQHILTRTLYPEVPPKVEYTLTPKGYALGPIFSAMRDWADEWV